MSSVFALVVHIEFGYGDMLQPIIFLAFVAKLSAHGLQVSRAIHPVLLDPIADVRCRCAHSHTGATAFGDTQAPFVDAVNVAAFFLTNSCTLSGPCPVSVSTSSDIRS